MRRLMLCFAGYALATVGVDVASGTSSTFTRHWWMVGVVLAASQAVLLRFTARADH
jgi:TctA family transporter